MRTQKAASLISLLSGILIFCIGLFFKFNNLTTSGASAGRSGIPPGSATTLNAKSLFIIGTILILLGIFSRFNKKKHDKEMEYLDNIVYKKENIKKKRKRKRRISK